MHWLPLVAMVIASALPFPHDPASRIVAATTTTTTATPDLGSRDRPSAASSASPPRHHDPADANMADGERQNRQDVFFSPSHRDDSGVYELNLASTLDAPPTEEQVYAHVDFNGDGMPDSRRTRGALAAESDAGRLALDGLFEGGEFFLDAQPRVLFSASSSPPERPPELLALGGEDGDPDWDAAAAAAEEGHGDGPARREKRSHAFDGRWVQRSVCESRNYWVTDKATAVDNKGNTVSIIQEIQTQRGPIKQYFYETRCVQRTQREETGVEGASCLGIDKKQWNSRCIAKQSFVRALTKDADNRVGWRWIRIDSSCVCVLMSRTNSRREAGPAVPGRGRG